MTFAKFMCKIIYDICHELYSEGRHLEKTCTNLQNNSTMCEKFSIWMGLAWEVRSEPMFDEEALAQHTGCDDEALVFQTFFPNLQRSRQLLR